MNGDGGEANPTAEGRKPPPGLYVVATPIGNLEDLTRRAERILGSVDRIVCEDTRVTAGLLQHLGIRRPLLAYHEHNAERVRPQILRELEQGAAIALVSDAGTPLISDPGFKLVRAAVLQGSAVIPIPGPSAVMAALCVAGLPTDRFLFQGFLPAKAGQREKALEELAAIPATLVLYESARRLPETLAAAAGVLGPRPAVVARELTKLFEEVRRGRLDELAAHYAEAGPPKGEVVVVVGPPEERAAPPPEAVEAALREALAAMKPRAAAALVAERTGIAANELYRLALTLRER